MGGTSCGVTPALSPHSGDTSTAPGGSGDALAACPVPSTSPVPPGTSTPPPACLKTRAARVRAGKGDKLVTYERAHPPHYIGHRKGWLSLHTGNLCGERGAAQRALEDAFLRRFLYGTFPGLLCPLPPCPTGPCPCVPHTAP
ncbi:LOW QUALITY PROTEIN: 28S ribosomal protein S24, mitochondrial [Corvus hawaiiensis]|uniref:LOW QUALITY PROTEIN: 28S ribosomal protein S24, mitochondrial n=1 Tax=Corvus hawaiiensis TaxID=134902 RepID=UPI00201861E3|nr:LOW QUALITY PROTEIN: 28S ribosomal protein S24, mitochondrial [Corvus hawaiiensis]